EGPPRAGPRTAVPFRPSGPRDRVLAAGGELDDDVRGALAARDHRREPAGVELRRLGAARVVVQGRVCLHPESVGPLTPRPARGAADFPGAGGQRTTGNRAWHVGRERRGPVLYVRGGRAIREG